VSRIVECYSGVEYADRPTAFFWRLKRHVVDRICSRALTPDGDRFEVLDDRGEAFILSYNRLHDIWLVKPGFLPHPEPSKKT
jgi:hypothetical protein